MSTSIFELRVVRQFSSDSCRQATPLESERYSKCFANRNNIIEMVFPASATDKASHTYTHKRDVKFGSVVRILQTGEDFVLCYRATDDAGVQKLFALSNGVVVNEVNDN